MATEEKVNISKWYDEFTSRQKKEGINLRHKKIMQWLQKAGLKRNNRILEIGSGIGTQTQLLAEFLSDEGFILSNDISEKSIDLAKKRLFEFNNIKFLCGDIINIEIDEKFDIILLPDVLEHIPIKEHFLLFRKLKGLLNDDGSIVIHIPNPYYLKWCHENTPELLQIIDQPIFTDELLGNTYSNNFYMHFLETYSIWFDNNDYQIIILKQNIQKEYKPIVRQNKKISVKERLKNKIIRAIREL